MTSPEQFTIDQVRDLCSERYFARGKDYFNRGLVATLTNRNGWIEAQVLGTYNYQVHLRLDDGIAAHECNCPIGIRGDFCKHCVATALAWLAEQKPSHPGGPAKPGKTQSSKPNHKPPDLRAWLMQQRKATLADMLLDAAGKDEHLQTRLMLNAATGNERSLAMYRKVISQAIGRSKFIDYYNMPDYFRRVDDSLDHIQDLQDQGHSVAAIQLSEWTLVRVERAIERVDDSDGYMSILLDRLQEIHFAACVAARPNQKKLAERLFNWELNGDWDTFHKAAGTYAAVLGDDGIQQYRKLAEAEWANIRPLKPGENDAERWGKRYHITCIMETLAELSGDIDALVGIKQKDLSSSYQYFDIALTLLQAGQEKRALQWAEEGQRLFGDESDSRLSEILADLYHRAGRHDDAMAIIWPRFVHNPCLANYQNLKLHADRSNNWPDWKLRALTSLREAYATQNRKKSRVLSSGRRISPAGYIDLRDHSLLVEILMWEGDIEAAWQEAVEGDCRTDIWLQLARHRESRHPRDAIAVYQRHVGFIVEKTNNAAYAEATDLIRRIAILMKENDSEAEFQQYLEEVRSQFQRKRNFIKMLAAFD